MTTIYIDAVDGSDANAGTSTALPKLTYEAARTALGGSGEHQLLFKRGQTHTVPKERVAQYGLSATQPCIVGAYGDGSRPRIIGDGAAAGGVLFWLLSGFEFVEYRDILFDGEDRCSTFSLLMSSASNITGIRWVRCGFTRSIGNGLTVQYLSDSAYAAQTLTASAIGCDFTDNGAHGSYVRGGVVTYQKCTASNNGLTTGAHGFSTQGAGQSTVTGGWSGAGPVYTRAMTNDVWGVFPATGVRALAKNTATPTTPAAKEYGWAAGTLYINLGGTDPAGVSIVLCDVKNQVTWDGCRSYSNKSFTPYAFEEGAGFQTDDFTSFATIRNCLSHGNDGGGFACNTSANCVLETNASYGNAKASLTVIKSNTVQVSRHSSANDGQGGFRWPRSPSVAISASSYGMSFDLNTNVTLHSIALQADGKAAGIYMDAESAASAVVSKVITANATALFAGTTPASVATSTLSGAAILTSTAKLVPGSSAIAVGTHSGYRRDLSNVQRPKSPSIGAYDVPKLWRAGGARAITQDGRAITLNGRAILLGT